MPNLKPFEPMLRSYLNKNFDIDADTATVIFSDIERIASRYSEITLEMVLAFLPLIKYKTIAAGEHLYEHGSTTREIVYVIKGLLRAYKVVEKGEELTLAVRPEGMLVVCWEQILLDEPSYQNVDALEDTTIIYFENDDTKALFENSPEIERFYYGILIEQLAERLLGYQSTLNRKPQARYLDIYYNQPKLLERLPQRIIASYIGVTPVSLSRLKKRLEKEEEIKISHTIP
jgi:CRP-like cAMP-binding protein